MRPFNKIALCPHSRCPPPAAKLTAAAQLSPPPTAAVVDVHLSRRPTSPLLTTGHSTRSSLHAVSDCWQALAFLMNDLFRPLSISSPNLAPLRLICPMRRSGIALAYSKAKPTLTMADLLYAICLTPSIRTVELR